MTRADLEKAIRATLTRHWRNMTDNGGPTDAAVAAIAEAVTRLREQPAAAEDSAPAAAASLPARAGRRDTGRVSSPRTASRKRPE